MKENGSSIGTGKKKETQENKQRRTWGSKKNEMPASTSTPKKLTSEGVQSTARKDPKAKEEQRGEVERINREKEELQNALESATEGMQRLNLVAEQTHLQNQNWRLQH